MPIETDVFRKASVGDIRYFDRDPGVGWLKCDGRSFDRRVYPELGAILPGTADYTATRTLAVTNIMFTGAYELPNGRWVVGGVNQSVANSVIYTSDDGGKEWTSRTVPTNIQGNSTGLSIAPAWDASGNPYVWAGNWSSSTFNWGAVSSDGGNTWTNSAATGTDYLKFPNKKTRYNPSTGVYAGIRGTNTHFTTGSPVVGGTLTTGTNHWTESLADMNCFMPMRTSSGSRMYIGRSTANFGYLIGETGGWNTLPDIGSTSSAPIMAYGNGIYVMVNNAYLSIHTHMPPNTSTYDGGSVVGGVQLGTMSSPLLWFSGGLFHLVSCNSSGSRYWTSRDGYTWRGIYDAEVANRWTALSPNELSAHPWPSISSLGVGTEIFLGSRGINLVLTGASGTSGGVFTTGSFFGVLPNLTPTNSLNNPASSYTEIITRKDGRAVYPYIKAL